MADNMTPAVQQTMQSSLERALDRISSLETPTPAAKAVPTVEVVAVDAPAPVEYEEPAAAREPEEASPPAAAPAPPAPPATSWGPQQQQALHQILQANTAMESELKALRDKSAQYEAMIEAAKVGDVGRFTEQAQIDRAQLLDALKNEGTAPASMPYVRKLEAKLAALEQQWEQRAANDARDRELADIASQLNSSKEYGILKQIPDAAARIQALRKQREADAKSKGEIASALTVEQAAAMLKGDVVSTLKRFLSDNDVRKELGLGDPVTPDTVKAPRPKKAITAGMTSQGSTHKTTTGYDPDERLRLAMRKVTGA